MNKFFMDRLMRVVNELKGGESSPPTAGPNATVEPTPPVEPPVVNYPNNDPTDGERKPKEEKEPEIPTQPEETPSQPTDQPAEPEATPPSEPPAEEPVAPTEPVDEPKAEPKPVEPEPVPVPEPEQPPAVADPEPEVQPEPVVPPTEPEVPPAEPEVPTPPVTEPPKPEKYVTESVVEIRRYQRPAQIFPLNSTEDVDKKLSISDEFVDVIYNPAKKELKLRRLSHHDSSRFNVVTVDRYNDGTATTRSVGTGIQKGLYSNSPELTANIQELYDSQKRWSAFSVDGPDPSLPKTTTPAKPLEETEDGELIIDHPPEVTQPAKPINITDPSAPTQPATTSESQPVETPNTGVTTDASTPVSNPNPTQPVTQPPKNTSPPVELEEGDELEI